LAIGLALERLTMPLTGAARLISAIREGLLERLGVGSPYTGALLTGLLGTGMFVRVGRASSALRTRLGPEE
jgi:hypothetical protein